MRIQKKKRTDLSNQRKWISKKNSRSMFCVVSILSLGCTVFPRNNLIKSVAICMKFIIFRMLKNMYILIGFFSVVFLFLFCRHQLPPKSPQTFNSIWNVFLESKNVQLKTECTWSSVHFFIMFRFPLINIKKISILIPFADAMQELPCVWRWWVGMTKVSLY